MLGAVVGDVIGSFLKYGNDKTTDFHLFSDESDFTGNTVLNAATMDCLLTNGDYAEFYRSYTQKYPERGYIVNFYIWILDNDPKPYNGQEKDSALRACPVGWAFDTIDEVLAVAETSASVTHNHPEGVKGAQATAAAVFLARTGKTKPEIREYIETAFGYDLSRTVDQIRPGYKLKESCRETVPEAITAFLESDGFESAIRLAVSLGGDSDTLACITGSIAEAFYGEIPLYMIESTLKRLPPALIDVITEFSERYRSS
ncbi:MAG: ADP-ribosylglycohydrolase family protein [Marinilabiliales bacterium]|nr:MAG: ADP-ribosylglycohydrolase family protein [Marinilabiliales bacterium]